MTTTIAIIETTFAALLLVGWFLNYLLASELVKLAEVLRELARRAA